MKIEYFECACSSPEHTIRFVLDDDKSYPALYAYVFLEKAPWHKRIINSLKYIFGYTCKFGHFDEFILDSNDCDKLINLLKKLKKLNALTSKKFVQE